jgi:hypothetical protein
MRRALRRFDNRLKRFRALVVATNLILFAIVAQAQQPSTRENTQATPAAPTQLPQDNIGPRRIQVVRVSDAIKIDGLLNEPVWSMAEPATDFREETPTEGAPASEKTEVRVLYDDKNLYLGIRAFDADPAKINARDLVRDSLFATDDRVEIILDTYHDRRNAFRFAVNPLGTQQDALITDEGRDVNLSWDGLKRSYIGAILVNRQGATIVGGGNYNRVGGADAEFNITDHYKVKAFWMGSATPGVRSSAGSSRIESIFENDLYRFITVYEDVGAKFNPEVGFIERNGIHQYFGQFAYKPRPKFIPHVQQMEFETQIEYYTDRAGKLATRQTELSWDTIFQNSSEFFFRPIEDVKDVLTEPFQIRPGIVIPAGTYHFNRPQVSFTSDQSLPIVFTAREKWGDFYSGKRYETSGGITWRPNPHVLVDLAESYNRVRLAQGNFTTSLFAGRFDYDFSRKLLTSALRSLVARERRSTDPTLKKLQGINRAQRPAERAKSRRARRGH